MSQNNEEINSRSLDKSSAIMAVMHLLDAANILTSAEPHLAKSLIDLASSMMKSVEISDDDIKANADVIEDIASARIPDRSDKADILNRIANEK